MNKPQKNTIYFVLILLCGCVSLVPIKVGPAPDLKIEPTVERVARGEYLANAVTGCFDCHSEHKWDNFAIPIVEGTKGKGGEYFGEELGVPGTICLSNITPYGLGEWTDGEIFRAIVSGVNKNGDAIFPMMPYMSYATMDVEDIYSIIAYLRTLKSIPSTTGKSKLKFPLPYIIRTMPKEYVSQTKPDPSNEVEYGKYLVGIAGCVGCHTPMEGHNPIKGMEFAGGSDHPMPGGALVRSSNLTPDKETGIGEWERDDFIDRFKEFATPDAKNIPVVDNKNTTMGWTSYAEMTEEDLGAIYSYLMSLEPINNAVELYPLD
ncbi:MAG: cytochrome C [Fidelibacterota bacterium]